MPPLQSLLTIRWLGVKIFCCCKRLERSFDYLKNTHSRLLPATY
jgi:hypothetical protein